MANADPPRTGCSWLYTLVALLPVLLACAAAGLLDPTLPAEASRPADGVPFTAAELAAVNIATGRLYLAILGDVFDVSEGNRFYGRGKDYEHFVGRDASPSFATGKSEPAEELTDSLDGLSREDLRAVAEWHSFYVKHEKYVKVGVLAGRYYDSAGVARPGATAWRAAIEHEDELRAARKQLLPDCNSKWSQQHGSEVWCTERSGGIQREWVGVPRRYREALDPAFADVAAADAGGGGGGGAAAASGPAPAAGDEQERCVCVRPEELVAAGGGGGGLAHLREYEGCPPEAARCRRLSKHQGQG